MGDAEAPAGFDVAALPADSPFRKFLAVAGGSDGDLFRPMQVGESTDSEHRTCSASARCHLGKSEDTS